MVSGFVEIGSSSKLRSASSRHHITLRSRANKQVYHSLLLFSFPKADSVDSNDGRFYCMEATCPHLGAPLENASIYDVEDEEDIEDAVIVCPWHEYDFSLSTGESSTGLKACVYAVEERQSTVWVQEPTYEDLRPAEDSGWDVVEVRPVSESFCDGREAAAKQLDSAISSLSINARVQTDSENIPDPSPLPQTLVEWAVLILNTAEPALKVEYTRRACQAFRGGKCRSVGGGRWSMEEEGGKSWITKQQEIPPDTPPRLSTAKVVQPGREAKRGKGGSEKSRIAMLHSLANIEQWAIDLAWDIIARAPRLYAETNHGKPLPMQFFSDYVKVAEDEAKHFTLLCNRLKDMNTKFGDLPVHHGLWESASETKHSLMARLCIIHLVHEARGLDANPLTIKKFDNAGDKESVEVSLTEKR
jgi:uncharacterized ferritin-like protein (DUF455 family)/nitrite reductase/ring-hydroxylating ferredoxin subunit